MRRLWWVGTLALASCAKDRDSWVGCGVIAIAALVCTRGLLGNLRSMFKGPGYFIWAMIKLYVLLAFIASIFIISEATCDVGLTTLCPDRTSKRHGHGK